MAQSLQEKYAPTSICFGCGPKNTQGLQIRSCVDEKLGGLSAEFFPKPHHEAFPNVLNGGIVGALLDCHSNWTACWHIMTQDGLDHPPCTVTAEFSVKLLRPTPSKEKLRVEAVPVKREGDKVWIEAKLLNAAGKPCASCSGIFVAVKPGHPAYYRW